MDKCLDFCAFSKQKKHLFALFSFIPQTIPTSSEKHPNQTKNKNNEVTKPQTNNKTLPFSLISLDPCSYIATFFFPSPFRCSELDLGLVMGYLLITQQSYYLGQRINISGTKDTVYEISLLGFPTAIFNTQSMQTSDRTKSRNIICSLQNQSMPLKKLWLPFSCMPHVLPHIIAPEQRWHLCCHWCHDTNSYWHPTIVPKTRKNASTCSTPPALQYMQREAESWRYLCLKLLQITTDKVLLLEP